MLDLEDKSHRKDRGWRELCEAASREHDPEKLLELVIALNDVLEQMELEQMAEEETDNRSRAMTRAELSRCRTVSIVAT